MGKYFITGRPGSGKSTVIRELRRRGYNAFDTDQLPEITKLEDQTTGEIVAWPDGPVDWKRYRWNWQDAAFRQLLAGEGDIFIGAIVGNQQDYYALFNQVFALTLSEHTLAQRLDSHEHIRTDVEKTQARAVHEVKQARFRKQGLQLISSERPVSEIVEEILLLVKPKV